MYEQLMNQIKATQWSKLVGSLGSNHNKMGQQDHFIKDYEDFFDPFFFFIRRIFLINFFATCY
jgi:hypothetical protein